LRPLGGKMKNQGEMGLRIRQLLGGLIPSNALAERANVAKEGMVVGEYPLGVDGKSDGF